MLVPSLRLLRIAICVTCRGAFEGIRLVIKVVGCVFCRMSEIAASSGEPLFFRLLDGAKANTVMKGSSETGGVCFRILGRGTVQQGR